MGTPVIKQTSEQYGCVVSAAGCFVAKCDKPPTGKLHSILQGQESLMERLENKSMNIIMLLWKSLLYLYFEDWVQFYSFY